MGLHVCIRVGIGLFVTCLVACDAGSSLQLPPVVSEGSERKLSTQSFAMPAGVAETDVALADAELHWNDLLSLTVVVRGAPDDRLSLGIEDAEGRVLIDSTRSEFSPNRSLSGWGMAVAQIPVAATSLPLRPPYTIKVRRKQTHLPASALTLQLWTKHPRVPSGVPMAQELPVQVIMAGARVDPMQVTRALDRARQIWRQAGLEISEEPAAVIAEAIAAPVARVRIDPALQSDSPSLRRLWQLSSSVAGAGLPLFLVQDIGVIAEDGSAAELWAVSAGVPVPPLEPSQRAGLAVSAELLKQDPQYAGQIIAHELGHALGLFHSTEARLLQTGDQAGSALHDGFNDTAACPPESDRDRDGVLSSGECQNFDAGNLMFWGTARGAISLSASQADVARRSLLAR